MKKLLIGVLLLSSLSASAQHRKTVKQSSDGSGLVLASVGALAVSIGLFIPDGSEWRYSSNWRNGTIVYKPIYQNPARMTCIGLGLTISIGGLIYNKNNK